MLGAVDDKIEVITGEPRHKHDQALPYTTLHPADRTLSAGYEPFLSPHDLPTCTYTYSIHLIILSIFLGTVTWCCYLWISVYFVI